MYDPDLSVLSIDPVYIKTPRTGFLAKGHDLLIKKRSPGQDNTTTEQWLKTKALPGNIHTGVQTIVHFFETAHNRE